MKTKLLRTTAMILAICLANMQMSCSTMKSIGYEEVSKLNKKNNYLVLNTPQRKYGIAKYSFENDSLKGKVFELVDSGKKCIYVYTQANLNAYELYKNGNKISLSYNDISKLEYKDTSPLKTTILVTGILGLAVLLGGVCFSESYKQNFNLNGMGGFNGW